MILSLLLKYFSLSSMIYFLGNHTETEPGGSGKEMVNTTCSDEFFFDNNSQLCKPECGVWTHFGPSKGKVIAGFRLFASSLGMISSVLVLTLSCVQYKTM